jgi:hypothetical protein
MRDNHQGMPEIMMLSQKTISISECLQLKSMGLVKSFVWRDAERICNAQKGLATSSI